MTKEQKMEVEQKLNRLEERSDIETITHVMGIEYVLDVLGYWVCQTKDGYKIKMKQEVKRRYRRGQKAPFYIALARGQFFYIPL